MISVIISGHGDFATALEGSSKMIFGEEDHVVAIPFLRGEGIQTLEEKYKQALEEIPLESEVLFLVDIFGGTPYNAATPYILKSQTADMVSGANLPMLLEVLAMREHVTLKEMLGRLKKVNEESFQVCSEHLKKLQQMSQIGEDGLL
ncbi:mannose/fructose/sorbose PTS transporter subunit IIA [Priestia megaterium]|uniref:mannose/fructose/sorbose PTS transporter subunit IIA n=1 Tax=Priestia megaterium TaxID=1404 RepID=UPI0018694A76|nr:mannose/fructose/sorbose PTS transporter subunit IIA [Priestia megaterium]MBE2978658.1 PTS fructose transporter subunit IIA [Priestia megaterium]MDH3139210.1 mannose/fructose/sorbose PTS transporter subunit IIA [Priestia megaterium]